MEPIALPEDQLPATTSDFLTWVEQRASTITADQAQAIREHLYALIAADVKSRYARTKSQGIPVGDTTLARLYDWAHRLGTPGAAQVANAILPDPSRPPSPVQTDGFDLTFTPPVFSLAARAGRWMVQFPFYFMPGLLTHQHLKNELENDIAMISTLTARNTSAVGGASQATILIASAPSDDLPAYTAFWLAQFGLTPHDTMPIPVPQATRAYRSFDAATHMWRELVAFQVPSGSLVVALAGLDGTYQANRPHFIDLLSSLRVR